MHQILSYIEYNIKSWETLYKIILCIIHDHPQSTSWYNRKTLVLKWKHIILVILETKLIKLHHWASFTSNKSWINYKHNFVISTTYIQYCHHVLKLYRYKTSILNICKVSTHWELILSTCIFEVQIKTFDIILFTAVKFMNSEKNPSFVNGG